jgi:hypothetical protein
MLEVAFELCASTRLSRLLSWLVLVPTYSVGQHELKLCRQYHVSDFVAKSGMAIDNAELTKTEV